MIETVVCELGGLLATGVSTWCLKRKQFGSGRSTISKFPQHLGVNLQQLVGMHNANMYISFQISRCMIHGGGNDAGALVCTPISASVWSSLQRQQKHKFIRRISSHQPTENSVVVGIFEREERVTFARPVTTQGSGTQTQQILW